MAVEDEDTNHWRSELCSTSGPWKWKIESDNRVYVETDEARGNEMSAVICNVGHVAISALSEPERHISDAKLIARAPELRDALVDAIRLIEHLGGNASLQIKAIDGM